MRFLHDQIFGLFMFLTSFGWILIIAICYFIKTLKFCLCKHDFEKEEADIIDDDNKISIKVSLTCKKCGYHKSFDKF